MKDFSDWLVSNKKRILTAMFLLTLGLRTFVLIYNYDKSGRINWSDDWYYLSTGEQIASGNWNPSTEGRAHMMVAPVIPLLVALFKVIFNDPVIPLFILNIILTSLTVIILFLFGRELYNETTGFFAAVWGILFTDHFKYLPHILKEPLLYFLLPLTLLLLIRGVRNNKTPFTLIWPALAFTVLIHTDERFVVYLPLFALAFAIQAPFALKTFIRKSAFFLSFVILLSLPWGIRNYLVFGQPVIISPRTTVFTSRFWGQNLEPASSHFADETVREKLNAARMETARQFGEKYGIIPKAQSRTEARVKAFINFWQPAYFRATFIQYGFRPQKWSLAHNISGIVFYGIFLPFFAGAVYLLLKRRNLMALFVCGIPVIHGIIHAYMVWPLERYRSPVNFIIAVAGIWLIGEIVTVLRSRKVEIKT